MLTGEDTVTSGPASVRLEHMGHGARDRAGVVVAGWDVLEDAGDEAVLGDEQHIEGDAGVVHPERMDARGAIEGEEHAVIGRHGLAEHEPSLLRGGVDGDLDVQGWGAGGIGEAEVFSGQLRGREERIART